MTKKSAVPKKVKSKINQLLEGFEPIIQRTTNRPNIMIVDDDTIKIHHLYMIDGIIKYIAVDINTGESTELIIESDSESEIEIRFMMYASLVMKLPLIYQNISELFKIIEEHKLDVCV
ncbi:hypothetical protein [Pectobacterium cacticida]|uniref:hypothetical protein n=1 Tax=Pectobacterium cacticida TaxID=69221 RepID=UPI002FF0DD19